MEALHTFINGLLLLSVAALVVEVFISDARMKQYVLYIWGLMLCALVFSWIYALAGLQMPQLSAQQVTQPLHSQDYLDFLLGIVKNMNTGN